MTDDILQLMEQRRVAKDQSQDRYDQLNAEIKRRCQEEKEKWINEECERIENSWKTNSKEVTRSIRRITGKTACSASGCLKAKDGTILMEKDAILARWSEYIQDLFEDERGDKPSIRSEETGPEILQTEVTHAMRRMKKNKAPGPDKIVMEMIQATEDVGIREVTCIANAVYSTGDIPEELLRSVFIALPKKPGAIECELHRTISLMSHITKIILRVLIQRMRRKIRPELDESQFGFVPGKGTVNATYIMRTLSERAIEKQRNLYLCFIDYTKAFDRVRHTQLMEILNSINVDKQDIRVVQNLYWDQTATIRLENELGEWKSVKRGVRQGCVMSPDLFSLYSEVILRDLEGMPGIKVGGKNINNIRYADDTVLIATTEEDLQKLIDQVITTSEQYGLALNSKKTFTMTVSKSTKAPSCDI